MNVLLTGATGAIGKKTAIALAKKGYDLYLTCAHRESEGMKLAKSIRDEFGVRALCTVCDLSEESGANKLFDEMRESGFEVEGLIHCAGIAYIGLLQSMTLDEWRQVMNTNITSSFLLARGVIPNMLEKKEGKMIFVSSVWGRVGASMEVAYSTSKGALDTFCRALARELAPSNIQVNSAALGYVDTPMNAHLTQAEKESIREQIPSGRLGSTDDVAKFLVGILESESYHLRRRMDVKWKS